MNLGDLISEPFKISPTPYKMGQWANNENEPISANPFPAESAQFNQWVNGWIFQNDLNLELEQPNTEEDDEDEEEREDNEDTKP